jgi:hypothetical protein
MVTPRFESGKVFIWATTAASYPVSKPTWPLFDGVKWPADGQLQGNIPYLYVVIEHNHDKISKAVR